METNNRRPFLTSDKELIKQFFLLYIGNLYQTDKESNNKTTNNKTNRTQKNNSKSPNTNKSAQNNRNTTLISKYNSYIQLISEIYETTQDILFRKLYETTINYRNLLAEINDTAQDFYYVNVHGSFIRDRDMKPKLIPEKTVLIFLTPVNRYGITCNLSELSSIKDNFKNKDNRLFIQQNLPCLDKFSNNNTNNKVNTRYATNYYKMFKNAIILYSGQYYYDLNLEFTKKEDNGKNMNINYFTGDSDSQDLIKIEKDKNNKLDTNYYDLLSNIVDRKFDNKYNNYSSHNLNFGIRYIIVYCCRNIDYSYDRLGEDLGRNIYIYENFMFYYNVIMANCNSIKINTFITDIRFDSYSGSMEDIDISQPISKQVWDMYGEKLQDNFFDMLNRKPEIIENLKKLFLDLLPGIDEELIIIAISRVTLKHEYGGIFIDKAYMFEYLYDYYEYYNKELPLFLKYVKCINSILFDKINNAIDDISDKAIQNKPIDKSQLETLKDDLNKVLDYFEIIADGPNQNFRGKSISYENFRREPVFYGYYESKLKSYIDEINICLQNTETDKINLETWNELYELTLNDFFSLRRTDCDLFFPGMQENYDKMLLELNSLLDTFFRDPNNIIPERLANTKKRGNSKLGNKGRRTLMKKYFKKTNNNTRLSIAIKRLIEVESNKVISQLNLQGLENETNV